MPIAKKVIPKAKPGSQKRDGRPTVYNQEDFKAVCNVLASSQITLKDACASNPSFMDEVTFWRMLSVSKENKELYQLAKFNQTEVKADYLDCMMNEHPSMYIDAQGIERVDAAVLRAKIDVIKWSVAVNNTNKFSLKNNAEVTLTQIVEDTAKIVKELNEKNKREY